MKKTTRILVVDDNPAILQVFSEMLRTQGYEVWEASTGWQGLQATREKRPDVVLLDVVLPDLSGIEVCRQIKADAALPDVFVVLFSGEATGVAHKVDGLETGADDYITKAVAPDEFLARIRTIVRLRDATAALRASEQHYRQLIEILPDAVCLIDLQGRVTAVNQQGVQMTGYASQEELLEKSAFDLIPSEDHVRLSADIARTLETGAVRNAAYTLLQKSGDRLAVELNASVLMGANNRPVGIVVVGRDITERKRAEKALRESEERFRQLTENITEVFWMTNLDKTRMIYVSPGYEKTWGRTRESLYASPRRWLEAVHPDDRERVLEASLTKQIPGQYDEVYRIVRPDGSLRWIQDRAFPVRDESGEVYRIVGIAEDITERKRMEVQLATLAHAIESTSELICITDLEDRFTFVNRAFQNTYGYTEAEIIGKTCDVLFSPENPPLLLEKILEQSRAGGWRGEVLDRRKDGTEFPVFLSTSQIKDQNGRVIGIMGMAQDITERKRAEKALKESEARYRELVDNQGEGLGIVDPQERFVFVNPAGAEIFGVPPGTLAGRSMREFVTEDQYARTLEQTMKRRAGEKSTYELEIIRPDGDTRCLLLTAVPRVDEAGRFIGTLGLFRDITERKRAEGALREAEARYRNIFENATEGIFQSTPDGHLLVANPALARMFGYESPEEMISSVTDIERQVYVSPERRRELKRILETEGSVQGFEAENYRKDGSSIWIHMNVRAVRDASGAVLAYQGTNQDDTERKWAENLLQIQRDFGVFLSSTNDLKAALERLLAIALQNSGVDCGAVHLVDPKTGALDLASQHGLSARFAKRASHFSADLAQVRSRDAGQGISEPHGKPLAGIVRQLKREGLRAMEVIPIQYNRRVVAVMSLGSHVIREIPVRCRQAIESIVTQAGGAIARIRAEQSLHANRQLLEKTLNSLHDAVFLLDAHTGIVQECNSAATHIFGHTRDQMVGRTPDFLHPTEVLLEQLSQHLPSGSQEKGFKGEFELQMKRKDGKLFPTEHTLTAIKDETGRLVSWVNVVREITGRKRAEEELRQLSQRIIEAQEAERLRVARELHDGVNQIIASAKMRLRKVEDLVEGLNPAAREILARCDRLLVHALEENRRIAHNLRPSDLDELGLDSACRNFCNEIQSRTNLAVKSRIMRLSRRLPPAVELNLFRVVQEALNNVEKHARAKTVRLRLAFQNGSIVLRIQDDGRGFDPRAVRAGKGKTGGIGLTNMRERAAFLGGTCQVESVPKQGTVITVRVPCLGAK